MRLLQRVSMRDVPREFRPARIILEVSVIVTSVTLVLAVNGWREDRQQNEATALLMESIRSEVDAIRLELGSAIQRRERNLRLIGGEEEGLGGVTYRPAAC